MTYRFGDVVLVPFPFTNQTTSKKRPAVIVSNQTYNTTKPDVVVMAITSQLRPSPAFGETWITDWQASGLIKPSAIKPVLATIDQTLILRNLGSLSGGDQAALRRKIADFIGQGA